jgi:hypothetical protein
MAFYHFDLVDSQIVEDAGGHECGDLEEARKIAQGLAIRLAKQQPHLIGRGFAIAVRSQDDEEVYRIAIDVANRMASN